jgi:predicted phosphodiesterase
VRVALISDMHGNAVALDAVLRELSGEELDEIVSLGDVAQGGPQPRECVDRLRELGCRCVFGNSDEFLLTLDPGGEDLDEEKLERLLTIGRWSQEQLGDEGLAFLRSFEPTVALELDGCTLVCCHGSPRSNEEIVLPETPREEIRALIGDAEAVAGGHVHRQWLDRFGRQVWIGVGSVGLAYDYKEPMDERPFLPFAEYAFVDVARGQVGVEFRRIPYDVEPLLRAAGHMPDEQYATMWSRE